MCRSLRLLPRNPNDMKPEFSYREEQLSSIAEDLIRHSAGKKIWLLSGEPGAGKTTLIKAIVKALGGNVDQVNSPTFSILNQYPTGRGEVFHFDLYRVNSEAELYDIGMDEYLDSGSWCFIEWPEKLQALMPAESFRLKILHPETAEGLPFRSIQISD